MNIPDIEVNTTIAGKVILNEHIDPLKLTSLRASTQDLARDRLIRSLDTEDRNTRAALIEMGWTPPAEGEPDAWKYELAHAVTDLEYVDWRWHLTTHKPNVQFGIRNLQPLRVSSK